VTGVRFVQHASIILAAGLAGTVAALAVQAQEDSRTVTTARIESQLEFDDNYDLRSDSAGDSVLWNTTIGAGLRSRTAVDTLSFDASGVLRVADLPVRGTETSADNPVVLLSYDRTVDDSSVGLSLRGQRSDVEFFDPLGDIDDDGNFDDTTGEGTRNSLRLAARVALNADGPLSFTGFGRLSDISFEDATDPDLEDRRNATLGGEFGFRLSPVLTLTTGGSIGREEIDDARQTERNRWRADVGMVGRINQRATLTARVGYSRVDTERRTGDETQEGVVGDLRLAFAERRGETSFSFSTDLDENGERYTLSYGKSVAWDNSELSAMVGVSTNQDTDLRAVGNVNYRLAARDTALTLGLRQSATTDEDGQNVLNTNALAQLDRSLTRDTSIGLTVEGGLTRVESDRDQDAERVNVTARVTRALTRDWNATAGYRYRFRGDEVDGDAESNAVFVGLARTFTASR